MNLPWFVRRKRHQPGSVIRSRFSEAKASRCHQIKGGVLCHDPCTPATTGHPKNQAKPSRVAPMIARRAVRAAAHKIAVSPLKEIRRTRRLGQNLSLRRWLLTSLLGETVPRGGPYGAQGNVQKTNTAASMIGSGESAASPVGTSSRKTFDSSAKSIV